MLYQFRTPISLSRPKRYVPCYNANKGSNRFPFRQGKGAAQVMVDDKSLIAMASRERDRELLIPVEDRPSDADDDPDAKASSSSAAGSSASAQLHSSGREVASLH